MSQPELTCQELVEIVTDYLEGALPHEDAVRFDEHIADCDGCDNYLQQFRVTIEVVGQLTTEDVPDDVCDHLLGVFRDWKTGALPG